MRPPPNFGPRRSRRWPLAALAASVAVHGLLLFGWIEGRLPLVPPPPPRIVVLPPLVETPRAVEMAYPAPRQKVGGPPPVNVLRPRRLPELVPVPAEVPRLPEVRQPAPVAIDTGRPTPRAPVGRIGPNLGEGVLWVTPLPLPPRELAKRLRKSHTDLVDSAVTATIQAFLDSMAREPGAELATLPKWSTEIGGKEFGIDEKYLYVAGLKIPAAVLALLPISGGTNQQRAFDRTDRLLTDLRMAANRAQTLDDFKAAIRELREQREREHEFKRNQRTAPPPELRSPPPAPPATAQSPPPRDTVAESPLR